MLFEDECSLSNTATIGYQWSQKGKQPQVLCKQRKRERQTLFGSYNYGSGQITAGFADKGNNQTFKKHLKKVLRTYREAPEIIMVLDNVAYHHARKVTAWVEKNPKLSFVFLPPYSPDLNAVERAWWYMRKKITHNRYLKSFKERKKEFWKMFSHFFKPNNELKHVCEIKYWTLCKSGVTRIRHMPRGGRRRSLLGLSEEAELLSTIEQKAGKGVIKTAGDIRVIVESKVGKAVSDDYLWDLLNRNGWKKKMPRPHHPKRSIAEQQEFKKKLPNRVAAIRWHAEGKHNNKPVVVFFEDEGRFGRISREMYCWIRKDVAPQSPGK